MLTGLTALGLSAAFNAPNDLRSIEPNAGVIEFPIEVMSAKYPHVESFDVDLTGSADAVEITANNLNYSGKGRIRIGSGPWVTFDNSSVSCTPHYERLGCIGYPGTIVFRISYNVQSGVQPVQLELARTDGFSSGYRVLDMRFLKGGSAVNQRDTIRHGVIRQGELGGDATRGKQLFEQRNRWDERPGGQSQIAACNDCHTAGRDLKYFGFSDHSIVVRTVFHGGTEAEGRDIAAYVANLNVPTHGTPWDPPYQPGPGLDSKPTVEWAAGAGLEAVVSENATRRDVFGADGITRDDFDRLVNHREVRLSDALPDWNQWLPRQHPIECHAGTARWDDASRARDALFEAAASGNDDQFYSALQKFNSASGAMKNSNGSCTGSDEERLTAEWSALAWRLVIGWYAHQAYGREDDTADRMWHTRGRFAFNLAPHIANVNGLGNPPYRYAQSNLESHFSHLWYQLQVVLNAGIGDPKASGQNPVDWGYQNAFLQGTGAHYRAVASRMTQLQSQVDGGCAIAGGTLPAGVQSCISDQAGNPFVMIDIHGLGRNKSESLFRNLPEEDALRITTFALDWYLSKLERVDLSTWVRGTESGAWESPSYNPQTSGVRHNMQRQIADMWWERSGTLKDLGVPDAITRRWDAMGEKLWPLAKWENLTYPGNPNLSASDPNAGGYSGPDPEPEPISQPDPDELDPDPDDGDPDTDPDPEPAPSATEQGVTLNPGWNMVSSRIDPDSPDIEAVFAGIKDDVELVKDGDGNQYHPASGLNTIGDWSPLESYQVYATQETTLQLSGQSVASTTPIVLEAGWNQIPFLPSSEIAVEEALGSAAGKITLLKDYAGRIFYPAFGIDEIGSLRPGQGYKVHTSSNLTLSYPTSGSPGKVVTSSGFDASGVASSATLILNVPEYATGLQIAAFSEADVFLGEATASDGLAVLRIVGDDEMTSSTVEGARDGETIKLTVILPGQDQESEIDPDEITSVLTGGRSTTIKYLPDAVLAVNVADLPQHVELEQNYPNPFSGSTSIGYSIGRSGPVSLQVFNVVGERVAIVIDEEQEQGLHTVDFDASHLASGVYVYRLISADKVEFKQMIVVK